MIPTLSESAAGAAGLLASDWLWVLAAAWLLVACTVGALVGSAVQLSAATPTDDADWLLDQPAEIWLTDDEINARIPELEALLAEADQ